MLLSLIVGIILGALAVIFAFQNVAVVTVSFLTWQITASLAIIILGTVLCGIILTLLFLLPSVIRDEIYLSTIKKQKREAEDELAKHRTAPAPSGSTTTVIS
jgi:putative membrane protein